MKTIEYRYVDRSDWKYPYVPADEPDKVQYQDESTGMPCLIVRGPGGALCGYVGVNPDHPLYEKGYSDDSVNLGVHGGITFADFCAESNDGRGICHIPEEGEEHKVWWFGFDCAHYGDVTPRYDNYGGTYKDIEYVRSENQQLAAQLNRLKTAL